MSGMNNRFRPIARPQKTKIESGVYRYTATDGSEWIIRRGTYHRGYGCVIWRTMFLTIHGWRRDFTGEGLQRCIDMIERGGPRYNSTYDNLGRRWEE